jgi:hypothetical protein
MDWTVIVAVVAVRMVQMAVDEIVDVVPVRHLRVAAARPVDMARSVTVALVIVNASVGVRRRHFEYAFVDVIAVRVMQVPVVQVVDVPLVFDRQMAAARTMLMLMPFNFRTGSHIDTPFRKSIADEVSQRRSMVWRHVVPSAVYRLPGEQAYRSAEALE